MVICLERDAYLHMAQLMPLPLTVSCFSKIQIGFTFLVPAHTGSPGQRAVKRVFVVRSTSLSRTDAPLNLQEMIIPTEPHTHTSSRNINARKSDNLKQALC